MSAKFRIVAPTPGLRANCYHGQVTQFRGGDTRVVCNNNMNTIFVSAPVETCSTYEAKSAPRLHEMEAVAWILRTDPNRRVIGFTPPKPKED